MARVALRSTYRVLHPLDRPGTGEPQPFRRSPRFQGDEPSSSVDAKAQVLSGARACAAVRPSGSHCAAPHGTPASGKTTLANDLAWRASPSTNGRVSRGQTVTGAARQGHAGHHRQPDRREMGADFPQLQQRLTRRREDSSPSDCDTTETVQRACRWACARVKSLWLVHADQPAGPRELSR